MKLSLLIEPDDPKDITKLIDQLTGVTVEEVEEVFEEKKDLTCPKCKSDMIERKGSYGKFYGCTQYPSCKGTRDERGKARA